MLREHQRFNHIPFSKIQEMARQGILPRRLAKCAIPVCSACLYAKSTKRKWRDKPTTKEPANTVPRKPGEVVSVDQLVSSSPGLTA